MSAAGQRTGEPSSFSTIRPRARLPGVWPPHFASNAAGTVVVYREEKLARVAAIPHALPVAPPFPLSLEEQRALLEFAERSQTLTTERLQELATLPEPLVGTLDPVKSAARLIGMANYVAGK